MSEPLYVLPTVAVEEMIAAVATDADLPPTERLRELGMIREALTTLQGDLDSRMGDVKLEADAVDLVGDDVMMEARANADVRQEVVRRGLASAEQMDALGYLSHDQLDAALAAGDGEVLQEAFTRAWGLGRLRGEAFNRLVRRGRGGQFQDKPGSLPTPRGRAGGKLAKAAAVVKAAEEKGARPPRRARRKVEKARAPKVGVAGTGRHSVELSDEPGVKKVLVDVDGTRTRVYETPQVSKVTLAANDGPKHPAAFKRQIEELNVLNKKYEDVPTRQEWLERGAVQAKDGSLTLDGEPVVARDEAMRPDYEARAREQGERLLKALEQGLEVDDATGVTEGSFNAAHSVSQTRLLDYARSTARGPTTEDMHALRDEDGNIMRGPDGLPMWDPDRQQVHEQIIDLLLRRRTGAKGKDLDPDGEYLPSQEEPSVLFSGGGYAAGKSAVTKGDPPLVVQPGDALLIDPDQIKALLPEFTETFADDPESNLRVYAEAWAIAQQLQRIAQERKMNVIVDGISNTSADEVRERVAGFQAAGYKNIELVYVDIPTEEALSRAANRAKTATDMSDRRHIPETIMRAVHRDVAATIPGVLDMAPEMGISVKVFDNNQGKDEDGRFRPPKAIYSAGPDGVETLDQELADALRLKAAEGIEGVDAAEGERKRRRLARLREQAEQRPDLRRLRSGDVAKGDYSKRLLGGHRDTMDLHTVTLADGNVVWSDERAAMHRVWVEELLDGVEPPRDGAPKAVFTAGIPASGKSSAVKKLTKPEFMRADPDEVKEKLDEYNGAVEAGDAYAGTLAQRESRHVAALAVMEAQNRGLNVVIDGSGGGPSGAFRRKLEDAHGNGYGIEVAITDLSPPEAKERAAARASSDGRYVPGAVIDYYAGTVPNAHLEYRELPWVDWKFRVNDVPFGQEPRLAASSARGGTAIEFQDRAAYEAFLGRAAELPSIDEMPVANTSPPNRGRL